MAHLASRSVIIALAPCMLAGLSALSPAAAREVVAFIAGSGIRPTKAEGVDRPTSAPDAPAAAAPIRTAIPVPEPAEVTITPADSAAKPDLRPTATTPAEAAPVSDARPVRRAAARFASSKGDGSSCSTARPAPRSTLSMSRANTRRCGPKTAPCTNGRRRSSRSFAPPTPTDSIPSDYAIPKLEADAGPDALADFELKLTNAVLDLRSPCRGRPRALVARRARHLL